MKGKTFLGGLFGVIGLAALVLGIIIFISNKSNPDAGTKNTDFLYAGLSTGAGATLLLNSLGIWAGFKSLGGLGMLISAALIAFGIYAVVMDTSIPYVSTDDTLFIGSMFIAIGAMTILSSLGIVATS